MFLIVVSSVSMCYHISLYRQIPPILPVGGFWHPPSPNGALILGNKSQQTPPHLLSLRHLRGPLMPSVLLDPLALKPLKAPRNSAPSPPCPLPPLSQTRMQAGGPLKVFIWSSRRRWFRDDPSSRRGIQTCKITRYIQSRLSFNGTKRARRHATGTKSPLMRPTFRVKYLCKNITSRHAETRRRRRCCC